MNLTNVKYFMHEDYDDAKYKNDIALVRIPKIPRFDTHKQTICLSPLNVARNSVQAGKRLHAVGWGGTKHVNRGQQAKLKDLSSVLKEVSLPFLANKDCAKKVKDMQDAGWKNWYFNNKTQFCAGDKLGKSDTCHGDSGGPAMVKHYDSKSKEMRWYQVGIVSWGYGCAQKDEYSYYTKVSSFLNWIKSTIEANKRHDITPATPAPSARPVTCPQMTGKLNLAYKTGLNLIFVLDVSQTTSNFIIAKEFIKKFVRVFGVDRRKYGTRIACVVYGSKASVEFSFNDASVSTLRKAKNRIKNIIRKKSSSKIGVAVELALREVKDNILPMVRKNSQTALFLVAPGSYNVGVKLQPVVKKLKAKCVELFVVGVGNKPIHHSLRRISSDDVSEHLLSIRNYGELKKMRKFKFISYPDYSQCGQAYYKPADARPRIVGGVRTKTSLWPWNVRVYVRGDFHCGGAIINEEFVLTAAHCLIWTPASLIKVRFGEKGSYTYTSLAIYLNPHYDRRTYANDIALIKIPKLKRFSRYRQAICLPRQLNSTKLMKPGDSVFVVGWGITRSLKAGEKGEKTDFSAGLKQVELPFSADKECAQKVQEMTLRGQMYWYFNRNTQFCARDKTGVNDTCTGDGGGPAMVLDEHPVLKQLRWYLVGLASWGNGCAQKNEYAYFTKVSAFLDWIDKVIKS